jgi:hypothetical protein
MVNLRPAVIGALVTAAVSTFGDYMWANVITRHRPVFGIAHGIILFLTVGACLGAPSGQARRGAIGAALVGFIAAGSFYVLQPLIGYWTAMFVLWFGLWTMLGVLTIRGLQGRTGAGAIAVRSACAAAGSGVAFYLISGIWAPNNPHGWGYLVHFASWTFAYLPAFASLLVWPERVPARAAAM